MIRPGDLADRMVRGHLTVGLGPTRPLTDRQSETLDVIRRYKAGSGEPAPAAVIARRLGVSHERVRHLLTALHAKGYLTRESSPADPL